jgi:two-component system response regulator AtoC
VLFVNARIVAATHEDLPRRVEEGLFRADLLYRLSGFVLRIPPLRDRPEDIEPLSEKFAADAFAVTGDGLAWLQAQPWPGNVRQLERLLHAVAVLRRGRRVDADVLREAEATQCWAPLAKARAAKAPQAPAEGTLPAARAKAIERELLSGALDAAGGNVSEAARRFGLERMAFTRKARRHGLLG